MSTGSKTSLIFFEIRNTAENRLKKPIYGDSLRGCLRLKALVG
jgi:hypothetical protein